jgi:hypothetical protein
VPRLGLIYDMQVQSAQNFARRKMDLDPDVLDQFPAYRLTESTADEPRGDAWWRSRWNEAGAEAGWDGALRSQYVALKTSPIWLALSRFGVPWPPFDFGSTRELEDVDRAEAERLELLAPAAEVPGGDPRQSDPDFNQALQARLAGTVWTTCRSWYRDDNGRIVALWPGFTREYVKGLEKLDDSAYDWSPNVRSSAAPASPGPAGA